MTSVALLFDPETCREIADWLETRADGCADTVRSAVLRAKSSDVRDRVHRAMTGTETA